MISVAMLFGLGKLYHDGVEAVNENYSTGFALEGARSMEPNLLQHGDHLSCWSFLRRKGGRGSFGLSDWRQGLPVPSPRVRCRPGEVVGPAEAPCWIQQIAQMLCPAGRRAAAHRAWSAAPGLDGRNAMIPKKNETAPGDPEAAG